jgi:hypothetical protein
MPETTNPTILFGDGKSPETAIRFSSCEREERIRAEHDFICKEFGREWLDWERGIHFTTLEMQSNWNIRLKDGTRLAVYFDTDTGED